MSVLIHIAKITGRRFAAFVVAVLDLLNAILDTIKPKDWATEHSKDLPGHPELNKVKMVRVHDETTD